MDSPLVSVICTCYNHGEFIREALDSVAWQHYDNVELLVIDNGSSDCSGVRIGEWIDQHREKLKIKSIFHPKTINYCQSFNQGLATINGKYVVDLSGDDVLLPGHLSDAVHTLERHPETVYFSNAYLEKEPGSLIPFYALDKGGGLVKKVPSGDIYAHAVRQSLLCPPTLVFPSKLMVREGGYDESLSYEDFDIIVRMARRYPFSFCENLGVKKRILKTSFSARQYRVKESIMLPSTLKVCRKIQQMNRTVEEDHALAFRVMFEAKHALASANFDVAAGFLDLAEELRVSGPRYTLFRFWEKFRMDLSSLYRWLLGFR